MPVLTVTAVVSSAHEDLPMAQRGPSSTDEFEHLLSELLTACPIPAGSELPGGRSLRIDCTGVFGDTTPILYLDRRLVGELARRRASIAMALRYEVHEDEQTDGAPPSATPVGEVVPETEAVFELVTYERTDPDVISTALELTPTSTIQAGDRQPLTKRPSPTTRWELSTGKRRAWSFEDQLGELLSTLATRADAVATMTTRLQGAVALVARFVNRTPDFRLSEKQVDLIHRLGLEVGVDLEFSSLT